MRRSIVWSQEIAAMSTAKSGIVAICPGFRVAHPGHEADGSGNTNPPKKRISSEIARKPGTPFLNRQGQGVSIED